MSMMSYINRTQDAIDFAEDNLKEAVTFGEAATVSGFSVHHFHRIFSAITGTTFCDYLRRRRLTEAGRELLGTGRRIIDIALDYCFESQESFTRAFARMFGMTPGRFRKAEMLKLFYFKRRFSREILAHLVRGVTMEPKIVELGAFTVVGMRYFGDNKNQEIKTMWEECKTKCGDGDRCGRNKNAKPGSPCLGVCSMVPGEKEKLEYIAGVMVENAQDVPDGLVSKEINPQKYAVFTHKGNLATLNDTYNFIYATWLPNSGFELADSSDFEWYDDRFKDFSPDSEFDIYIPIR